MAQRVHRTDARYSERWPILWSTPRVVNDALAQPLQGWRSHNRVPEPVDPPNQEAMGLDKGRGTRYG